MKSEQIHTRSGGQKAEKGYRKENINNRNSNVFQQIL